MKKIYSLISRDLAEECPDKTETKLIETDATKEVILSLIDKLKKEDGYLTYDNFFFFLVKNKIGFRVLEVVDINFKEYDSS